MSLMKVLTIKLSATSKTPLISPLPTKIGSFGLENMRSKTAVSVIFDISWQNWFLIV